MVLILLSLLSGILACFACPLAGVSLYRKFEAWLAQQQEAVRQVAARADTGKMGPIAARTRAIPDVVKRYFERTLRGEDRPFRLWLARQTGQLRFDRRSRWMPIESTTLGAVGEPAFSYTGTMQMGLGTLLWCRGREGLLEGRGGMQWKMWGVVPLAKQEGPQLDQCALVRYLAEAICFPPALLPSSHLKWLPSPTDPEHCASAVLSAGGAVVAGTFTFDTLGRIREMRTNDYYRAGPGGRLVRTPWFARCAGYMRFGLGASGGSGGVEIPTDLQVGWVEPDGSETVYGRFTVARLRAEL